ncbi:hypothetical protein L1887_07172 [Cichorium endivia]|nr:hypothetical protein L1887_07172 [Cichorium endivia]
MRLEVADQPALARADGSAPSHADESAPAHADTSAPVHAGTPSSTQSTNTTPATRRHQVVRRPEVCLSIKHSFFKPKYTKKRKQKPQTKKIWIPNKTSPAATKMKWVWVPKNTCPQPVTESTKEVRNMQPFNKSTGNLDERSYRRKKRDVKPKTYGFIFDQRHFEEKMYAPTPKLKWVPKVFLLNT